ncbi:MAG: sigma-70 family RNA polymerase sigma factor [Prevotella sp.]|jgi:RNA polymerase sigma-70 factor (ECF subfamily)|nr:sigma-70 family RNA polymerase sigma factor [Prevotella sp.]
MEHLENMTDEQLAMSYVEGNNRAFDILLSRNQSKLFSYIMFVVRDHEKANDVFQETFIKVITKLQEGKYVPSGKFAAWLMRIAHNIIIDSYRTEKAEQIIDTNEDNDLTILGSKFLDANIEDIFINEQVLCDVKKMMNMLPDNQREVIFMRFFQQMSFKEIAETTNVSINTSLGRMRYAVLNLRRMVKDNNIALDIY